MTSTALTVTALDEARSPFAYLHDGKRLVEVLWVEDGVVTVHDCKDRDEFSRFQIEKKEIGDWTRVIASDG